VQASTGLAALEIIQRLPESFGLILTELELRGIPGTALIETLRLFRPDLPVLCMGAKRAPAIAGGCLNKPLDPEALDAQLRQIEPAVPSRWEDAPTIADDQAVAKAKARYALAGDLVEAALELAKGLPSED